ncbi:cation:dicarboxylase symporter family transporter [Halieaceae bacterium IMCC14734]|uniref:Cation:dicarboxylase symporter family transporter n=1 Tax=Candidatus Litorirhabdus singularis TaxID=2518993 RepID=A0ABT3TDL8_9GAMM|nr:cation:dicarboxylase symporter family transporter [Candidatus Litorirhabdus singularis]MCX2980373.1 cation:dicarboxylase symporter family transporter [Candidatus Litorirhabdus singularis]
MGLSTRIFIGLGAGILTGLFFGESVAKLKIVGDVFIQLLQMTVLPYIVVSLIAGFGRMDMAQTRTLVIRGSAVLALIWVLALILIFVAALAFPELKSASFFSSPNYPEAATNDLLSRYVPANIFYSLTNNLIPAVVLFSILLGVSLISVKDKDLVIGIFDGLSEAIGRINGMIVQLTPIGIFAIAAAAAGTMTVEELGRVQVYLITYIALSMLVTFWIFPGLVSAVSGIPYREVLDTFKDALVTAFATGNQFVVLPLIAQNCKQLLARHQVPEEESAAAIDVIVPVSFNFPSLGKMLVLLFVLFAAWFTDTDIDAQQRLTLAFNGLFSLFGSINVAVPYMLDMLHVPIDMFQLFMVTGVVVGRFGAMLAALHIIVLSVIGTLAICGRLQLSWSAMLRYLGISAAAVFAMVLGLRGYFELFVPAPPAHGAVLAELTIPETDVEATVYEYATSPLRVSESENQRLNDIIDRAVLRVGYREANLPCTYLNANREVVGFDADMARAMAIDLGVDIEFVPFRFDQLGWQLDTSQIDIAMSCIASLPDRYLDATYSASYLDLKLAFVIPDHERGLFKLSSEELAEKEIRVALVSSQYFLPRLKKILPRVEVIQLESAEEFFSSEQPPADALLLTAEEGSAYSFRYPGYTTILPTTPVGIPAAYALPRNNSEWTRFVDNWVDLKRKDGTVDDLYQYWMKGGAAAPRQPRWSVIRDVLGWVD